MVSNLYLPIIRARSRERLPRLRGGNQPNPDSRRFASSYASPENRFAARTTQYLISSAQARRFVAEARSKWPQAIWRIASSLATRERKLGLRGRRKKSVIQSRIDSRGRVALFLHAGLTVYLQLRTGPADFCSL